MKTRLIVENGTYHVMNRGVARKHIHLNPSHLAFFINLLKIISDKYQVKIIAFCLMGNHYHLLINAPKNNLSLAMQYLNSQYAKNFNKVRNRDGYLYKGRFHSIVVSNERYLTQVSRYIHLNPVESGLVKKAENYEWSSAREFLGIEDRFNWLNKEPVLSLINNYDRYLNSGNNLKLMDILSKEKKPKEYK